MNMNMLYINSYNNKHKYFPVFIIFSINVHHIKMSPWIACLFTKASNSSICGFNVWLTKLFKYKYTENNGFAYFTTNEVKRNNKTNFWASHAFTFWKNIWTLMYSTHLTTFLEQKEIEHERKWWNDLKSHIDLPIFVRSLYLNLGPCFYPNLKTHPLKVSSKLVDLVHGIVEIQTKATKYAIRLFSVYE